MKYLNRTPTDSDIVDRTCDHKCSCCGSCCTEFIPLTRKEVNTIKDYLKAHPEIKGNWLSNEDTENLYAFCPFLNKDTDRCDIYPVRPFVCRDFKCDKSMDKIELNRRRYAERAEYNSFIKKDDVHVSLHYLFFGDYQFDFTYRRLAIRQLIRDNPSFAKFNEKDLTFEDEQNILPMFVDTLIKKGGN